MRYTYTLHMPPLPTTELYIREMLEIIGITSIKKSAELCNCVGEKYAETISCVQSYEKSGINSRFLEVWLPCKQQCLSDSSLCLSCLSVCLSTKCPNLKLMSSSFKSSKIDI